MTSVIKNRILSTLEGGGFQDLCDTLLYAEGYEWILSLGAKAGTLKTTKGNPDTYFLSESGKYIFVAYTTVQKDIDKKIRKDIEKCLDKEETGVDVKDIEKIICCHTSSTLSAGEDQSLRKLCSSSGIKLELYGIDEIAGKIYRDYPYIAKDKLNISIDSNQIFPMEEFIKRYNNSNGRTAPLNTIFLHRTKEKEEILEALSKEKVIIILGKAGVGKTRLALEAVKEYQKRNKYTTLCIKCNSSPIMDDLSRYISKKGKYLIFVDDANKLVGLSHLLEYVTRNNERNDIHIVATVRDYASKDVITEVETVVDYKRILIPGFTAQEMREFIKLNLKIEDSDYLDQIVRIAGGNPRVAYMAGKLAIEKNDLRSIYNMEELYKSYYRFFWDTTSVLSDSRLSKTAGIISIFNTIDLENLDKIQDIFEISGMTKEEFIEKIYFLHNMEYVEIERERVVQISDQCLSNYMLYYTFFEKKLMKFSDILRVGFRKFKNSTVKSVNIFLEIFYSDKMKDYLTEEVSKVWDEFKTDDKFFREFVKTFHIFKPEDSLLYVNEKIEQAESVYINISLLENDKKQWDVNISDDILQLLVGYRKGCSLSEAIELAISYCVKKQDIVKEVYSLFKSYYSVGRHSYDENYYTQNIVIDKLKEYLDHPIIRKLFYQLSCHYLSVYFDSVEIVGVNTLTSYRISVVLSEGNKQYRSKIWDEIYLQSKYEENAEDIIHFLCSYPNLYVNKSTFRDELKFDWQNILCILDNLKKYLTPFRFAFVCSKYFRMSKSYFSELTEKYADVFATEEWNLYKILSNRFYKDTLSYEEREAVFEADIKKLFGSYTVNQMKDMVICISSIIKTIGYSNTNIGRGIAFLCTLLSQDRERLWAFTAAYFKYGDNIKLHPETIVASLLKKYNCHKVQDSIWNAMFPKKRQWKFLYYEMLADTEVTQKDYYLLIELIEETTPIGESDIFEVNLRLLDKFKVYSIDIYTDFTKKILNQIGDNEKLFHMYFSSLFNVAHFTPKEILSIYQGMEEDLKQIYFKCLDSAKYVDYKGVFFSEFVLNDIDWIKCYVHYIQEKKDKYGPYDEDHRLEACWKQDGYSKIFDTYYNELLFNKPLFWNDIAHFRNTLSFDSNEGIKERKEQWIMHYIKENNNNENVVTLFRVLQEMGAEIRKKAILCFLEYNLDFEMFKRLSLVSNSWTGVASLTEKIMFYEELLNEMEGVKFLKHKKRIREEIKKWKVIRNRDEIDEILLKLYR